MQLDSAALEVAAGVASLADLGKSELALEAAAFHENVAELLRCAVLIFCAELGDKSFFVAMLLATDYNPWIVFVGCFAALTASTVVVAFMGHLLSRWLDPVLVELATGVLFLGFAAVLFWEWHNTPVGTEPGGLEEASAAIRRKDSRQNTPESTRSTPPPSDVPAVPEGYGTIEEPHYGRSTRYCGCSTRIAGPGEDLPWWRVLGLAFTLNFVSELGDKTQVTVLAQATGHDAVLVALGAMVGFALVTGLAVAFGSRMLKMLTQRKVLLLSMISFTIFGVLALATGALAWQERNSRSGSESDIDDSRSDEAATLLRKWRRLLEPTRGTRV